VNQDEAGEEEFFKQAERSRVVVVVRWRRCSVAEGLLQLFEERRRWRFW
jgi:hypothetical protein